MKNRKITLKFLEENNACFDGIKFVTKHNLIGLNAIDFINKLIELDKLDYASWLICRIFNRKQKIQYAVYSAELCLNNYESVYPDDKKPRQAIEAAKKVLLKNNKINRDAASSAASSAAYSAVYSAFYSAASSVSRAATSAAYSAYSAYNAACSAVYSAASSAASSVSRAAYSETYIKILEYGLTLLETK